MSQSQMDWDQEIPHDPEEEYQALLRALRRKRGFGLYFVQCSLQKGNEIIADLRKDLPQKNMQVLQLDRSTTTLYDRVEALWQQQPFEFLFIQGLENTLYEYEDTKRMAGWSSGEIYSYSWKGVPRILNHLNQQRERFRDNFNCVFVFLVPLFVVKYFIQRAPDFFDWRSGLFTFFDPLERFEKMSDRILGSRDHDDYVQLSLQQRNEKLLQISEALIYSNLTIGDQAELWYERGRLLDTANDYTAALSCYDRAIRFKPNDHAAWTNRGFTLLALGRNEEALSSCDRAIELRPDDYRAWINRGIALSALERNEEAIFSYDRAIELEPNEYRAWINRGITLSALERNEEAIFSCDRAIELKPNDYRGWYNRGVFLYISQQYEEAINSYRKALEIQPNDQRVWRGLAESLYFSNRCEEAIAINKKALEIVDENKSISSLYWFQGAILLDQGLFDDAALMFDKAVESVPQSPFKWLWRGYSLSYAKRYAEALESFDRSITSSTYMNWRWNIGGSSLEFNSNPSYLSWFGRSIVLVKMKLYRKAFIDFKRFLLNPAPYRDGFVILKAIYSKKLVRKQIQVVLRTILGTFYLKSSQKGVNQNS